MRFYVEAGYFAPEPPLPNATPEPEVRQDRLSSADWQRYVELDGAERRTKWWYGSGVNHRVEGDVMVRDLWSYRWWIDVGSLEGLLDIAQRVTPDDSVRGGVVVHRNDGRWIIRLYDGYIE